MARDGPHQILFKQIRCGKLVSKLRGKGGRDRVLDFEPLLSLAGNLSRSVKGGALALPERNRLSKAALLSQLKGSSSFLDLD